MLFIKHAHVIRNSTNHKKMNQQPALERSENTKSQMARAVFGDGRKSRATLCHG
jgi:hypothetical protein